MRFLASLSLYSDFSRQSTPDSVDAPALSDLGPLSDSEHESTHQSGQVSPSDIPDSPGQSALREWLKLMYEY